MRKINTIFLLLLVSCSVVNHENAELYWASFSHMDAKTYYSYLAEEHKENSEKIMTKYEFLKLREKGFSLEDLKNYRDFCLKNNKFFCDYQTVLSFIQKNIPFDSARIKDYDGSVFIVKPSNYLYFKRHFDNLIEEDGQQCIIKHFDIKRYKLQLIEELDKKVNLQNETKKAEVNKNIENLEKFIEQEYLKSFHEKISISLKNNFGIYNFKPEQWNFNNHYIRVTTDGNNVNVIKDDKLIFSSNINKYKPVDFNTTGNIYTAGKKKIDNLVETYKKNNISKDLQEKCKHYLPL